MPYSSGPTQRRDVFSALWNLYHVALMRNPYPYGNVLFAFRTKNLGSLVENSHEC